VIRLLGVELTRFRSRRLVRVGVIISLGLVVVVGVIAAATSKEPHALELVGVADAAPGFGPLFMIGALVLGASFLGADWGAGAIATQLTWEPRRTRVLAAKIVALGVGLFVLSVVLETLLVGALATAAAARGVTTGVDGAWARELTGVLLRTGALSALSGVVAFSIAMVSRTTAAALGIAFAWLAVAEGLVRGLRPGMQPWLIGDNAAIVLIGSNDGILQVQRSALGAGLLLATYAIIALVVAGVWFARRDVS